MTLPRSFVRPLVRPMVRSGAVGPYGGATYQDGIHLNFASGNTTSGYYVKAVGAAPTVSPLTSLFTFTGGNQSMYMGPTGLLVASATNTPRIEYDASGNCLGLLMEAARTNLCIQSTDVSNAAWTKAATTAGTAITGPDGAATAGKVQETAVSSQHNMISTAFTISAAATYTASAFFKAGERNNVWLQVNNLGFTSGFRVSVTALDSTAAGATSVFGTGTVAGFTVTSVGNGWWRASVTGVVDAASTSAVVSVFLNSGASYLGTAGTGTYATGFQVEAGAFPSSYIPTTTVADARTADGCFRTLGSEFSATAGTVVVAGRASGGQDAANNQFIYEVSDGTANERVILFRPAASDNARYNVVDGGVGQGPINDTLVNSTAFKHAATWATNDLATSFNGGAAQTDATATIPTMTTLYLGNTVSSLQMNGHILRFDYWPERKANAFLVSAST